MRDHSFSYGRGNCGVDRTVRDRAMGKTRTPTVIGVIVDICSDSRESFFVGGDASSQPYPPREDIWIEGVTSITSPCFLK